MCVVHCLHFEYQWFDGLIRDVFDAIHSSWNKVSRSKNFMITLFLVGLEVSLSIEK